MWGGTGVGLALHGLRDISIHPPRVGRDQCSRFYAPGPSVFQSTLPVWGGTCDPCSTHCTTSHFNPPSPCGEGRVARIRGRQPVRFQSTLPVWGGTMSISSPTFSGLISIHPPRVGRDFCHVGILHQPIISIHPPRVGRDTGFLRHLWQSGGISIHPPRVGRDGKPTIVIDLNWTFQSTLPVWGGTAYCKNACILRFYFNPPSPCGEGLIPGIIHHIQQRISIHPPRVGRDVWANWCISGDRGISIHPPRVGRDLHSTLPFRFPP